MTTSAPPPILAAYAERPPPAPAARVCEALWTVAVHERSDDWLVLPDGCVDIVLTRGEPPSVAGPATVPSVSAAAVGARTLGIRLTPGAASALLGVPALALRDQAVALADLGGRGWLTDLGRVQELLDGPGPPEATVALGEVLVRAARGAPAPDPIAGRAAALLRSDPALPVGALAEMLSLSERQLQRRFTTHVGYGPKRFARVVRLQRVIGLARSHPRAGLARLAAQAGYADQAHLARDCRALAGRTPTALLRQRAAVAVEAPGA